VAKKGADKGGGIVGEIIPQTAELAIEAIRTDAEFRAELARTVRAGIENLEQIERTGTKVLGPIGELWGWGGALIRTQREFWETKWQVENAARVYDLVLEKAEKRGLSIDDFAQIETRVAIPYREGISNEDNPNLQNLWAELILNSVDQSSPVTATKVYKNILSELEPIDAAFFSDLCKITGGRPFSLWRHNYRLSIYLEGEAAPPLSMQSQIKEFELVPPKDLDLSKASLDRVRASQIVCRRDSYVADIVLGRLSKIGLVERPIDVDRFRSDLMFGPAVISLDRDPPSPDPVTPEAVRETFDYLLNALDRWSISALGRDFAGALSIEMK